MTELEKLYWIQVPPPILGQDNDNVVRTRVTKPRVRAATGGNREGVGGKEGIIPPG